MKKFILLFSSIICAFSLHVMAQDTLAYYGWESETTFGPMGNIWNSAATIEEVTDNADDAHTGAGYLHVTIAEAPENQWDNQTVFQAFTVEQETSYRIGLWMKATTGDEPATSITVGNNDYTQIQGKSGVVLTDEYKYYSCMAYISSETALGDTDPTTIRFPIHFYGIGEIFVDDVIIAKSTIAGITYNGRYMAIDFGYPIDFVASVSPDAFTITVNGEAVQATSAQMTEDDANAPIVYLGLESSIEEGADVKVDYNGNESLFYTDYAPNDESSAVEFSGEGAAYDPDFDMPVGIFTVKAKSIQCEISPNPVANQLNIRTADAIQSYKILDLSGKMIAEAKGQFKSNININVSGLKTGIYMLQVVDVKGTISIAKFVKD